MADPNSLERIEALDKILFQMEQELATITPEVLNDIPNILEGTVTGLAGVLGELRVNGDVSDPQMRSCAHRLRQRTSRIKALLEYGEAYCATRLSNLGVFRGGYTASGVPEMELRGGVKAEA